MLMFSITAPDFLSALPRLKDSFARVLTAVWSKEMPSEKPALVSVTAATVDTQRLDLLRWQEPEECCYITIATPSLKYNIFLWSSELYYLILWTVLDALTLTRLKGIPPLPSRFTDQIWEFKAAWTITLCFLRDLAAISLLCELPFASSAEKQCEKGWYYDTVPKSPEALVPTE